MKNFRPVLLGLFVAFASLGLIIGSFSLSLAEGNMNATQAPTQTVPPTDAATLQTLTATPVAPTPFPTRTRTRTPSRTPSLTPTATICPIPAGWVYYVVKPGDTLDHIGASYQISSAELQQANCLVTTELVAGSGIYVPPISSKTPVSCGAPYSWIVYIVQPGDNLYRLSQAYGITVADLQRANCMGSSILLRVGQRIHVPPWAPLPPSPTYPVYMTPTDMPTFTPEFGTPTELPTETPTSLPTDIPADTPTETPTPSTPG
jgi:LysM repeat protein